MDTCGASAYCSPFTMRAEGNHAVEPPPLPAFLFFDSACIELDDLLISCTVWRGGEGR
jgi:hypothetical protein